MKSVLLVETRESAPTASTVGAAVADGLVAAGFHVLARVQSPNVVHETVRVAPDVVVCVAPAPDDALFETLANLQASAALPVLVITEDLTPEAMQHALDSGVSGWTVGWQWGAVGEARARQHTRLAAELQLAQARFTHEATTRASLADALSRLDERKWVERAKGVLMAARQIGEDDAFRLLRGASMHTNLRVGEVSRSVIEAAQAADAVNRAGQLRMLSQRLVRLLAQCAARVELRRSKALLDESKARVADTLERLQALPMSPDAASALSTTKAAWSALKPLLTMPAQPPALRLADAQAEALLASAEALTTAIEAAGGRQSVHIVNVCGRQRMLAQRLAKDALLDALLDDAAARERVALTVQEFGQVLDMLDRAPLNSAEIREALASARAEWLRMLQGLRDPRSTSGRQALARGSESLLTLFERLTEVYERSLQVIMGG